MANFLTPVRAASHSFILPLFAPRPFSLEAVSFTRISPHRSPAPHPFIFLPGRRSGFCLAGATQSGKIQTLSEACVVVDDEKYGKKQVISITPLLYRYILDNVREPPILRELREETAALRGSQMQVSPDQAQLIAMLVQILGAQRCIEVGVYTGYSSLAVALVLQESGHLVACERDEQCLRIAKKYYERAGVSHKVDVKHALAVDALESMIKEGQAGRYIAQRALFISFVYQGIDEALCWHHQPNIGRFGPATLCKPLAYHLSYDFAFVDAEKRLYRKYYELLLELVKPGGIIVIDNVLWHGKVADPTVTDSKTTTIRDFNKFVYEDKRVSISMVPIGDGMTVCRKL